MLQMELHCISTYQIRALFRSVGGTVFEFAQEYLEVPNGTFKATVLENHYSCFTN
jgi:hypothetical protein